MGIIQLADLGRFAEEFVSRLPQEGERAVLVELCGNVGAGKTTFVQAVGRVLTIPDTMQSPTYVLMKSYSIHVGRFTKLVHIDAYRLQMPEEFKTLKPEEFLYDPHVLVLLEWPQQVQGELPTADIRIQFSSEGMSADERNIEIK